MQCSTFAPKSLQCRLLSIAVLLLCSLVVLVCTHATAESVKNRHSRSQCSSIESSVSCPTWFVCDPENGSCECGDQHNYAVVCDEERLISAVMDCHCVTFDNKTGSTYLGACFYNCEGHNRGTVDSNYKTLPQMPELLLTRNESFCADFNRAGLLCGDCQPDHSPLVLSYNLSCVECPDGHKNWWKFILVAFVPLTFFYFFVVMFNINVTSSRLHGVVWFSQALSMPAFVRVIMLTFSRANPNFIQTTAIKVLLIFYSYWNLDILRSVLPDICLNVTTVQALALDYLPALYPFLLIVVSYVFIELYDRKAACIVAMWSPFRRVLTLFRKSWDIRTSIIDSFATFFLLSYIKVMSVSTDLLFFTRVYKLGSKSTSKLGVFYSPSVEYFGDDHRPYAILAVILLALFVCIPTLTLIFYPFKFFQKFLSLFPFNWHFLRAFVDSYQGCYKDGTEPGTFDCRWFSSLALLIRPMLFVTYGLTRSSMFFVFATLVLVVVLLLLINFQPFKKGASRYPSTDIPFFVLLSLCYGVGIGRLVANVESFRYSMIMLLIVLVSAFVPILYIFILISYWLLSKTKWFNLLINK